MGKDIIIDGDGYYHNLYEARVYMSKATLALARAVKELQKIADAPAEVKLDAGKVLIELLDMRNKIHTMDYKLEP